MAKQSAHHVFTCKLPRTSMSYFALFWRHVMDPITYIKSKLTSNRSTHSSMNSENRSLTKFETSGFTVSVWKVATTQEDE